MIEHLAIIMDGNGRWAKAHHLPRLMGHRAGADTLDKVMHWCRARGIRYLTVYAFSTENWKRSADEVSGLMKLLDHYVEAKAEELEKNSIRFRTIGRRSDLPEGLEKKIAALEERTKGGDFTLLVALSYGGRAEIVDAVNAALLAGEKSVTEETFKRYLYAGDVPDPDLIIRTSGELRTSNFLLWEAAYAEYYFTPVLWPDFDEAEFDKAVASFEKRERRMGGRCKS
jgi:undecaprenyl diphosphate synthase